MELQMDLLLQRSLSQQVIDSGRSANVASVRSASRRRFSSTLPTARSLRVDSSDSESDGTGSEEAEGAPLLRRVLEEVQRVKEPPRAGRLADVVLSKWFTRASVVVIMLNTVLVWHEINLMSLSRSSEPPAQLQDLDCLILLYYTVEVALRLCVHGGYFFVNDEWMYNLFDLLIVATGLLNQCLRSLMWADISGGGSITFLRVFAISKILRVFKAFRVLTELRLMATCVLGSIVSLLWASIFLFFVLVVAAFFLVQSTTKYRIHNPECPEAELCGELRHHFGTVGLAMLTLFQSSTGGVDWSDVYSLVTPTGPFTSGFFIAYILFFQFAVLNIVTSCFVDKALRLVKQDEASVLIDHKLEEAAAEKKLAALLALVDEDGSGTISVKELTVALEDPEVSGKFEMLGITIRDVQMFFATLTSISRVNQLSIAEFSRGCLRIRGHASAMDMQTMHFAVSELSKSVHEVRQLLGHKR